MVRSHVISMMDKALAAARAAYEASEVPVGAVIAKDRDILAITENRMRRDFDPTAHAEMLAIKLACTKLGSERLVNCDIFITLEPCPMCLSALSQARIRRIYYGADDLKSGGISACPGWAQNAAFHHKPEIYEGFLASESEALLKRFFEARR